MKNSAPVQCLPETCSVAGPCPLCLPAIASVLRQTPGAAQFISVFSVTPGWGGK